MPEKNVDLHGSAPDKHKFALLLIDVINDFDFPEGDQLLKHARPMARILLRLKRRAQKAGVPVIYINDNFGRWKSYFRRTVDYCARHGRGRDIVKLLRPEEDDYFVLKPKHSGFFSTTLETLLRYLETQTLILTGIAGNFCVLFTANGSSGASRREITRALIAASILRRSNYERIKNIYFRMAQRWSFTGFET
jgi:nicotinamidase-related amidase